MRPGYGIRHPAIAALLTEPTPSAVLETTWVNGNDVMPLRIAGYLSQPDLPAEFISSVRCIIRVGDEIVICQNPEGLWHPFPGGRRKSGESYEDTACREVHEETGWLLDRASITTLGWLHLEHIKPRPDDWPYPHPDFLQLVFVGRATDRDGGVDADWIDTDGTEQQSRLVSLGDARRMTVTADMPATMFLDALDESS